MSKPEDRYLLEDWIHAYKTEDGLRYCIPNYKLPRLEAMEEKLKKYEKLGTPEEVKKAIEVKLAKAFDIAKQRDMLIQKVTMLEERLSNHEAFYQLKCDIGSMLQSKITKLNWKKNIDKAYKRCEKRIQESFRNGTTTHSN